MVRSPGFAEHAQKLERGGAPYYVGHYHICYILESYQFALCIAVRCMLFSVLKIIENGYFERLER